MSNASMWILPVPGDVTVDSDGDITFVWYFGKQGDEDSWRIQYLVCAGEQHAHLISRDPKRCLAVHGRDSVTAIREWMGDMPEELI